MNILSERLTNGKFSLPSLPNSLTAAYSFWSRVLKTASPTAVRRFIPSYEAYVNAMVQEATERETRSIRPSIEEYLELRRSTGAIKPSFDLMLLPLDLPEEVSESAEVRELEVIAIDLIAVANVCFLLSCFVLGREN